MNVRRHLVNFRKEDGYFTLGSTDSADLLMETVVPPDSNCSETAGLHRLREEYGVFMGNLSPRELDIGFENTVLVKEFSEEEVNRSVWRMRIGVAHGFDGATAKVLKKAWPLKCEHFIDLLSNAGVMLNFRGFVR